MSTTRTTRARARAQSAHVGQPAEPAGPPTEPPNRDETTSVDSRRFISPDEEERQAERALGGGRSPLTEVPEEHASPHSRHSSLRDDATQHADDRDQIADELTGLVEATQGRMGDMRDEIDDALERQLELTARFHRIRQDVVREQEQITSTLNGLRRRLNAVRGQPGRKKTSDDGGVSYADPEDTLERSRNHLFRPRDGDEGTDDYQLRENAQRRLLAREHYEDGTRQRDRNAVLWWRAREAIELRGEPLTDRAFRQEYEFQRVMDQRAPNGGGSSHSSTSSSTTSERRTPPQPPNGSQPVSSSHGQGGRHNGGGAPGGPPGGGGSSRGGRSSSKDSSQRSGQAAGQRPRATPALDRQRRSPTYLDDRNVPRPHNQAMSASPHAGHVQQQLELIRAEIRTRLRTEIPDAPGLKSLKGIPSPAKYDGRDDAEEFMTWLKGLLRWLVLNRLGGDGLDDLRVDLLGQYVDNAAQDWYDDIVDHVYGTGRSWTFEETICELYIRFIHKSTARSAAEKFYGARYRKETGVNGLWDHMVKYARKMPIYLDDYSFNRKFVDALPEEITVPLFQTKPASVEKSTPKDLHQMALEQEVSNQVVDDVKASHRKQLAVRESERSHPRTSGEKSHSGPPINNSRGQLNRPMPRSDRFAQRSRSDGSRRSNMNPAMAQTYRGPPSAPEGDKGKVTTPAQRQLRVPGAQNVIATGGSSGPPQPGPIVAASSSRVQCYNCKDYGHIAANCPKADRPNMRSARVVQDTTHLSHDEANNETGDPNPIPTDNQAHASPMPVVGNGDVETDDSDERGDQYADAEEGYSEDDVPYGSQYDPDESVYDDDEPVVYFGAMRRLSGSTANNEPYGAEDDIVIYRADTSTRHWQLPRFWETTRGDFVGPTPSQLSAAPETPHQVVVEDSDEDDMYADMPELEPRTPPLQVASSAAPWHNGASIAEISMLDETREEWGAFQRSMEEAAGSPAGIRLRQFLFRMAGNNHFLSSELHNERIRGDRIQGELSWYQRELAIEIRAQRERLSSDQSRLYARADVLQERRERIRNRQMVRDDPLSVHIRDDVFEAEYVDDPSASTALRELAEALEDVTLASSHRGPGAPPAYRANEARMFAMHTLTRTTAVTAPPSMATRARVGRRPMVSRREQNCITILARVHGLEALVLFDSGSTTDSISPEFAKVAGARTFELENPAILQLGCVGSRSRISFGTQVPIELGESPVDAYLDVVNLDRYDVVLGTPFMRRHGVVLDFARGTVQVGQETYQSLQPADEERSATRRRATPRPAIGPSTGLAARSE
uniref:CCHC-type domain-containing protein n=1 Tax=Ganoderma boninense TaxID=34458 RepID=A0A5K1JW63_9APHY|nr:Uncharacterized protein [Ganoderma boninense]